MSLRATLTAADTSGRYYQYSQRIGLPRNYRHRIWTLELVT
jgi:hypothetical protein